MGCTLKLRPVALGVATVFAVGVLGCKDEITAPQDAQEAPALSATSSSYSWLQVSAGNSETCAIAANGSAFCWGGGYMGNGRPYESNRVPVPVSGDLTLRTISVGPSHTCGVTTDFRAYCWGDNTDGKLGDGTNTERLTTVPVAGGFQFRLVSAGENHSCGLTRDDRVYCWGGNWIGQLGNDSDEPSSSTPVAVAGGLAFRDISAGQDYTCAIAKPSQRAYCWGDGENGKLGAGDGSYWSDVPVEVEGGRSFKQIDAGRYHACAVTPWDVAWCWGWGTAGAIGDGNTHDRWSPRRVAGDHRFERISAGEFHTCAESTTNQAYCWGHNPSGGLGDGTTQSHLTPVAVTGNLFFAQISAGTHHTCGVTSEQEAYCWGSNLNGKLGDGTETDRHTPTRVSDPAET